MNITRELRGALIFSICLFFTDPGRAQPPLIPESAYGQLQWRLLGPFRGGWATMAVGVPTQPDTFYFGAAGGGVWKTVNAGRTWVSVGDALPASVGALSVAPSNPDTIYVGTGQPEPRYDTIAGRGMYKSTDGGRSWSAVGLEGTQHIGDIWIDPRDANVVVVAALGHLFGPNPERGIFRSRDGGRTWTHTLAIDEMTGAVSLAGDPASPDLLYAAVWQARVWPWLSYFLPVRGPGSGIYRSTDGGASWQRLGGEGWPAAPLGRIGLAVTRTSAGVRIYATVDSAKDGGVWRSDDGGGHWSHVHGRVAEKDDVVGFGGWYGGRITVDPRNPDVVYGIGRSLRRSTDAGVTWTPIKGAPGGDDYHFVWINPTHPERWITACDQGAVISLDDGRTWSDWYNQPTGQFYHLATDARFPYWIYSGQQDSGTVGAASRSDYGSLTFRDWHPVGGDERDFMLPDPDAPDIVYGSGLGGHVSRWDARSGQVANISPWPAGAYNARPTTFRYHYNWITPLVFTPTRPHALLFGAQVLFRSVDHGTHWNVISPDLTGKRADATGCQDDVSIEAARGCGFGAIVSIAPSPRSAEVIWVGTDSGLLQLTRDGGKHWSEVTPRKVVPWSKVSYIEASPFDPAAAYVAIDNQRQDDLRPHVFRTRDFGATWTAIESGLPPAQFVSVVRTDPKRRGLLYAGTAEGVSVSFDDGEHWQGLQLNLPHAWVRDLLVHDNDLIAATQGRAIWVLDDVSALRQLAPSTSRERVHLFTPAHAWRVQPNNNRDTPLPPEMPMGTNPPAGVPIDYWLGPDVRGPVTLEIHDSGGGLVRRFSSDDKAERIKASNDYFASEWLRPAPQLSAAPGAHRFMWNLRYPRPRAIEYEYSIAEVFGEDTPTSVEGSFVLPGNYTITLSTGGETRQVPLTLSMDPRVPTNIAALGQLLTFSRQLDQSIERISAANEARRSLEEQLESLTNRLTGDAAHAALLQEAFSVRELLGRFNSDTDLAPISERLVAVKADVEFADLTPTPAQRQVVAYYTAEFSRALQAWRTSTRPALGSLNEHLRAAGMAPLSAPEPAEAASEEQ